MPTISLIPFDRYLSHVYVGSQMIGSVEKDHVGNWVARDLDDRKLSELRPVRDGERDFNYFATRKSAVAALVAQQQ